MWSGGRFPRPQKHGPTNFNNIHSISQYDQYQRSHQGPGHPGYAQPQNFNHIRPPRRERLRGRPPGFSTYEDSFSFNSNNTLGPMANNPRGRSGIINAAIRNLPPKPPLQENRNSVATARKTDKNTKQYKEKQFTVSQSHQITYFCPKCGDNYYYRQLQNKFVGKIPLILQCSHTMCQECAYQDLNNAKVNCPTCKIDSVLSVEESPINQSEMQKVFPPNFHIIGMLSYYRPHGSNVARLENVKFVSPKVKKQVPMPEPSERCCFDTCTKKATVFCPSCDGIYCQDCCTVLHKSLKKLMSHEPVPIQKKSFTLALPNCARHEQMQLEFFCKTCDLTACCYCLLESHSDHERDPLYQLNETEMEELKTLKGNAKKALKEIIQSQKKIAKLTNFNTVSVKKDLCQYFADFHARLEKIETKLCDQLENFNLNDSGLGQIQASLKSSAEELKQLVSFNLNKIGDKKLNLRGALEKLRDIGDVPRFLLNAEADPVRFFVDSSALDNLEEDFSIERNQDFEYRLVTEKDLPGDYVNELNDTDSEVESEMKTLMAQSSVNESKSADKLKMVPSETKRVQKHVKPNHTTRNNLDMERIEVQHINSMDSFFVQRKSNQSKFEQLNKDIENYVKMGAALPVEDPQLHLFCLALYIVESKTRKEQRWCRARVTEIKNGDNGPLYEMFFVDYGKTQVVDCSRIRDIAAHLAQKKPFAIECMLHNPMSVNWNKNAHLTLATILKGKDVFMLIKSINAGIYEVDLLIASSEGGVTSVIDILVHATRSVDPINDDNTSVDSSLSRRKEAVYPTVKVFPNSFQFSKNQSENVTIGNIVDPFNIFVHLVRHQDAFKNMKHSLKKAFKSSTSSSCVPIEGTYVLVEYKDPIRSNWHRAFVKSVDLNNDQVYVLLVDWGINVFVPSTSIRVLEEKFTRIENQAILVKMAHVAPYNAQATWSPRATEYLQTYFRSQDVLKMVVHDDERDLQVALFDITGNVELCLNAMLVQNNLADSVGSISRQVEWPQLGPTSKPFSDEDGLMSSMLKKVDELEDEESDDEDDPGQKKNQIEVVKLESPDLIWIRFVESKQRFSKMYKELQIHYSAEQPRKDKWLVGELCVVELEDEFARGTIEEAQGDKYKVNLYDKVMDVVVPLSKIFVYNKYFKIYTRIVFRSHLAYIRPAGDTGNWSISSVEALQEIFLKHNRIYARRTSQDQTELSANSFAMDMWYGLVIRGGPLEPDKLKLKSINNFLVKLGFAYKIPRPPRTGTTPINIARSGDELLQVLNKEQWGNEEDEENSSESKKGNEDMPESSGSENVSDTSATGKEDTRADDQKADDDDDTPSNWIELVEKELGVLDTQPEATKAPDPDELLNPATDDEEPTQEENKIEVYINDWLMPLRLTNKDFRARVTCAEIEGHLYIHDEETDPVYLRMEENIQEHFNKNPPQLRKTDWRPGQLCTIKYSDGKWYRGKILKIKNPQEITVFMIDFGSDHDVSPDNLFSELIYTDIRPFATKVKLHKVYSKSGSWLSSDYDRFLDLLSDWCRIVVKGPLDVDLPIVEVYNELGESVNDRLTEMCPNLFRCSTFPCDQEEADEETVVIESIECEESLIEQSISENLEDENELEYKQLPLPEKLLQGEKVLLEIGGLIRYNVVALRRPDEDIAQEFFDTVVDIQDAVDSLVKLEDVKDGMPCLAPFSEDGVWYRARIGGTQSSQMGFVDVFFVDYGNSEAVSLDKIKVIPPMYMKLPQQTWELPLNIVLEEDSDIVSISQAMNTILTNKKKYVKLIDEESRTVDIYDENDHLSYLSLIHSTSVKQVFKEMSV